MTLLNNSFSKCVNASIIYDFWAPQKYQLGFFDSIPYGRKAPHLCHAHMTFNDKRLLFSKVICAWQRWGAFDRKGWSPQILLGIFKEPKGPKAT